MMKYTLQSIVFSSLFFLNLVSANYDQVEFIEFAGNEVFIPEKLGNVKLYKDSDGFHIFKDGEIYDVQNCFCDPLLRKMSDDQLVNFLGRDKPKIIFVNLEDLQINPDDTVEVTGSKKDTLINQLFGGGYISVNQLNDGEYILHAKIRLPGGRLPTWLRVFIGTSAGLATGAIIGGIGGGGGGAIGGGVVGGIVGGVVGWKAPIEADGVKGGIAIGAAAGGVVGGAAGGVVGVILGGREGAAVGGVGGAVGGGILGGAMGGGIAYIVNLVVAEGEETPVHDEEKPEEQRPVQQGFVHESDGYWPEPTIFFCN
jgi:hypothetical protein